MQLVTLDRYEIIGLLGTGADYEVRTAVDRESGQQVVLKRPVPQAITRQMHGPIEGRTDRTLQAYEDLADRVPQLSPLLGYTERACHAAFYGDEVSQEYRVMVFARAPGIPLVGDVRARILRVPIGLGQNLFALFPLVQPQNQPSGEDSWPVQRQLLDLEEQFYLSGRVLLDLSPQNVFYQPATGGITVIDSGDQVAVDETPDSRSRRQRDIHDFYLEMLKFYTTPQDPPDQANGYREPYGLRPVITLEQELGEMSGRLNARTDPAAQAMQELIARVKQRDYGEFSGFRRDLMAYLEEVRIRHQALPNLPQARQAWLEALELLRAAPWKKYDFDAEVELQQLSAAA
ncbi:MAG: hypothetical protein IIB31_09205 [Chloroflexi bacterium]|nr:hypothetical protein [Chloroflexota bacterium]